MYCLCTWQELQNLSVHVVPVLYLVCEIFLMCFTTKTITLTPVRSSPRRNESEFTSTRAQGHE